MSAIENSREYGQRGAVALAGGARLGFALVAMALNLLSRMVAVSLLMAGGASGILAADQPQWGEAWTRNMVSRERGLAESFDPKSGRNILWTVKLGTVTHSTPIVARGRVYIGTNNGEPRAPAHAGDRGVMMCFEEATGKLLWQFVVPKREEDAFMDWPRMGMSSPVTVEGERVYLVDNRGAVVCLDAKGLADGNDGPFREEAAYLTPSPSTGGSKQVVGAETKPEALRAPADGKLEQSGPLDADILWKFDMVAELGIWPHDAAHSSILIHGNQLYLNTGNGVDNTHKRIRAPDAPSLVVLDKRTGRLLARDDEHIAPDVFHNTWASPALAKVKGREIIFFCGGNGMVYGFEPAKKNGTPGAVSKLKKVFEFDFDPEGPKTDVHKFSTNRRESPSNIYGMPVFQDGRLYIAGGGDLWWGKNAAWLKCIDAAKADGTNRLVWSYALEKHVMSTPAVHQGMVFIADCGRRFHCVDAKTGTALWTHEIKGEVWASPYVVDGKVYLGTRSGDFYVFAASREKKVLMEAALGTPISATTTAANGVLYVATMAELFAVKEGAPSVQKH